MFTDGIFIIEGSLSENIETETKFNIPLAYPEDSFIKCHFDKNQQNKILCKVIFLKYLLKNIHNCIL